ncbi:hypothetical protein MRY87_10295 [bacterium]|nr:hypothetical protein [bacterium]
MSRDLSSQRTSAPFLRDWEQVPLIDENVQYIKSALERCGGPKDYANGFCYLRQATRGSAPANVYVKDRSFLALGSHQNCPLVVYPRNLSQEELRELCFELSSSGKRQVYIKKYSPPADERATGSHFSSLGESTQHWDNDSIADDDTFPELIVDLGLSCDTSLAPVQWIDRVRSAYPSCSGDLLAVMKRKRKNLLRLIRRGDEYAPRVSCERYIGSDYSSTMTFLSSYFGSERPEAHRAYDEMLSLSDERAAAIGVFRSIVREGDSREIVGFFCGELSGSAHANLYSNVTARIYPGLPEYSMLAFLRLLMRTGVRSLNLGGSEHESLQRYKSRWGPIQERQFPILLFSARS